MMKRLTGVLLFLAGFACVAVPIAAFSQTASTDSGLSWLAKPIRMVVPFPPGPALDLVARLAATKASEALGQPIVVENRSGANGMIGSEMVARAAPDGYTVLAATAGTHVTSIFLLKNLSYDPVKDFTPITAAVEPVTCVAVHPSVPARSVKELIEHAKRNPGKLSFGSSGVGSVFHLMGELFNQTTGADLVHVPYKGVAPAMADLIGGQVPVVFTAVSNALPNMRSGKARILAVLESKRYAGLAEIPSIVETVPGFKKPASWLGFFGPAGLPQPVLARLNAELVKALNAPDVRGKLDDVGLAVIANTPEQFAAVLRSGIEQYGRIVKAAGIQPE